MSQYPNPHDPLDQLLTEADIVISPDRIRRVRTAVLVQAHGMERKSLAQRWTALFGFRPAVLLATGLLGLFLGASMPAISLTDTGTSALLDYHPQGFLTGDFG